MVGFLSGKKTCVSVYVLYRMQVREPMQSSNNTLARIERARAIMHLSRRAQIREKLRSVVGSKFQVKMLRRTTKNKETMQSG